MKGVTKPQQELLNYNICKLTRDQMKIATDLKALMIAQGLLQQLDDVLINTQSK
jgi:hypothetical protein